MSSLTDEFRPTSPMGVVAATFVAVVALGVVVILAIEAPAVLFALAVVGPMMWFFERMGTLDGNGGFDGNGGSESAPADDEEALDRLRRRYADGELTDAEFERRLDRLLETETLEHAKRRRTREREPER